ncbi:hypothetical protein, partial [uncultured Halomonas sp.]|uniref:phage pre-tape measure protein n=1 Tax=uncultured Halomonas sp. TaxID=173971 RepID=UPI0026354DA5
MALKGWTQPATSFDLPGGGSVAVRGLSVDMVAALVKEDREVLVGLFGKITGRDDIKAAAEKLAAGEEDVELDVQDVGMGEVAVTALEQAPGLCAKVIAWAAGEPEAITEAAALPGPTQLERRVEVGRLTLQTTSPGKFLEAVITLAKS